jgi:LacI family transcriptional regulator
VLKCGLTTLSDGLKLTPAKPSAALAATVLTLVHPEPGGAAAVSASVPIGAS